VVLSLEGEVKEPADREARDQVKTKVREFARRYAKANRSIICRELLGVDLSTEEGSRIFKEQGLLTKVCAPAVRQAALILQDMLG